MNENSRKLITTNELYLNECISIMASKIKAIGIGVFDSDGNVLPENLFSIENYEHGLISCAYSKKYLKVNLNGTNFSPEIFSDDNGGFAYRVKPLKYEVISNNKKIDDGIYERRVLVKIGDNASYYRYIFTNGHTILLEYCSKDNGEIITIKDKNNAGKSKEELAEFVKSIFSDYEKKCEIQGLPLDKEESIQASEEEQIMDRLSDATSESFGEDDEYEIDVYSSDISEHDDPCEIHFCSSACEEERKQDEAEPYETDLSDKVEEFDYTEYINHLKHSDGVVVYSDEDETISPMYVQDESDDDVEEQDENKGLFDENYYKEDYCDEDEEPNYEDLSYESDFEIVCNGQLIKCDDEQEDIIDSVLEETMDANFQMMSLLDVYGELLLETKKIRAMMIARKRAINRLRLNRNGQANNQGNTKHNNGSTTNIDVSDDSSDMNIE